MIILNPIGLIGDAIGTIPVVTELAQQNPHERIYCYFANQQIFEMLPRSKYENITTLDHLPKPDPNVKQFDLHGAFAYAGHHNLHMTQAHFHFMGLPVPTLAPRPDLSISMPEGDDWRYVQISHKFDYALAPFSRSLPQDQKWPRERWQALVDALPNKQFLLFGDPRHDDKNFVKGPNVVPMFGFSLNDVAWKMRDLTEGVISVVTGISHMAHALGVRNYLLENQGSWGVNPDSIRIHHRVDHILLEDVIELLKKKG